MIGYAVGVMLAPEDGADARAKLLSQTRQLGDQQRELTDKMRSRVESAVEEGKRAAAEKRSELEGESGLGQAPAGTSREVPV